MRPLVPAALVALALLVAAAPALAGDGPSQGDRPVVGEETFQADLGLERRNYQVQGAVPVPDGADEIRVEVTWNGSAPAEQEITLLLCEGPCDGGTELRKASGGSPLEVSLVEAPGDRLGWEARERSSYDVEAAGTVTYLGPEEKDPAGNGTQAGTGPATSPSSGPASSSSGGAEAEGAPAPSGSVPDWLPGRWAGLLLTAGAAVATRVAPYARRYLPFVSREDARDHPVRAEIVALVQEEPGIHVRQLRRRVDAGSGQLDHHLRVLRDHDLLVEVEEEGYRCYFPPGRLDEEARRAVVRLKPEGARAVVGALEAGPAESLRGLADEANLSPSTVKYHVDRLTPVGVVGTAGGKGRGVVGTAGGKGRGVALTERGRRLAATLSDGPG